MQSSITQSLNKLKQATDLLEDFKRQHKGSKGAKIAKTYIDRIFWIYLDFVSNPAFTEEVRQGIRNEWAADAFTIDALNDKIGLLNPEQRELVESITDALLQGEEITFADKK